MNLKKYNIFNFTRRKPKEQSAEKEFCFIWYKKITNKNKTYYTQPFRTKVMAKTREEAKDKVVDFALSKMQLVIVDEKDFNKTDLSSIQKEFDNINKEFQKLIKKIKL